MALFPSFEKRLIEMGDVTINCCLAGNGPPVLLLHGFPQNLSMWAHVAPALANDCTVVCADLRGYGDSSKPKNLPGNSLYSFRVMARDQVGLMRKLGFERFHLVGHDRGARVGHRMALDHPEALISLAVLDIVPTHTMFMQTSRDVAWAYWHWYFLSQPEPFPERMIGLDPDFFYQTCLIGWGATRIEDFDSEMLEEYRRCWRDPGMIHGSCSDYRAAATIDLEHDKEDLGGKVTCPTLVLFGSRGAMAGCFDIPATWSRCCDNMRADSVPGGHFFVDQFPRETVQTLTRHLANAR